MESVWGPQGHWSSYGYASGLHKVLLFSLYPSITSRKTGGLEALLFLANTASRRILWWTGIRCFFLLFTSSLVWWRISWRRCTKMVLPTVFPGLSAAKLKDSIFVGPQIREVLKDTDFGELLNLKELRAGKHSSQSVVAFLVTHAYQITKPVLRSR